MSDLYMVHDNTQAIKCESYALVVLMQSLSEKYPGGIKEFFGRYNPEWNYDIAVVCSGQDTSVGPVVQDLWQQGFEEFVEYMTFTANRIFEISKQMNQFHEIQFNCPWLLGESRRDGVFVWYRNYRNGLQ